MLDATSCLLPFPSDHFTVADEKAVTGRRVALPAGMLPNTSGDTLDVTEWNRNDGFSPGTPVCVTRPASTSTLGPPAPGRHRRVDGGRLGLGGGRPRHRRRGCRTGPSSTRRPAPSDQPLLILHPAAACSRRATASRSASATCRTRSARRSVAPLAFRGLPRRAAPPTSTSSRSRRRDDGAGVRRPRRGRGRARSDLYDGVGLHGGVDREPHRPAGRDARRRVRRASATTPRRSPSTRSRPTDLLEPGIARVVHGTFQVPLYLDGDG